MYGAQTRFHLPVWLGLDAALKHAIDSEPSKLAMLQEMYLKWPFFRVTVDLFEMVFAKGDPRVAAMYDRLLVTPELQHFGTELRSKYNLTKSLLLKVSCLQRCLKCTTTTQGCKSVVFVCRLRGTISFCSRIQLCVRDCL